MENPRKLTRCAVNDCDDFILSRRRFPNPGKDVAKFNQWLQLCQNHKLNSLLPEQVYKSYSICSKHFLPIHFSRNNRLLPNAIPTLHLPDDPIIHETIRMTEVSEGTIRDPTPSTSSYTPKRCIMPKPTYDLIVNKSVLTTEASQSKQQIECVNLGILRDPTPSTSSCAPKRYITPKQTRSVLLSSLSGTRVSDLTHRERKLYHGMAQLQTSLKRARKKSASFKQRLFLAKKSALSISLDEIRGRGNPLMAKFFECQLRNMKRKQHGQRYTIDEKILALSLCKQSARAYRYWSKLFILPSKSRIMKLLNKVVIQPGYNKRLFSNLKKCADEMTEEAKYCVLIFDEMAVKPHLQYNSHKDVVEGFCDTGSERQPKIADHVLVFMVRGIAQKYKQAIWYSFCEGTTKTAELAVTIKEIIRHLKEAGLTVIATVCDQGSTNTAALNYLINERKEKHKQQGTTVYEDVFEVENNTVIPLHDPPHLLKGIRNNFLNKNIKFVDKNITYLAQWNHIVDAYKLDAPAGRFRYFKKLTDRHIFANKMNKMKVAHAAQIFSESVATGLLRMAKDGSTSSDGQITVPPEAEGTAKLLMFFNDLYDSVNGGGKKSAENGLRCLVTRRTKHLLFWNNAILNLENMCFIDSKNRECQPPSLTHWKSTLKNLKLLRAELLKLGFQKFSSRNFNQDPIENFFGQIRQQGAGNINPTCSDFGPYYKSLLIKKFLSHHSLGANCEEDDCYNLFTNIKHFIFQLQEDEENVIESEQLNAMDIGTTAVDDNVISFIAGYLTKTVLPATENCSTCKEDLTMEPGQHHHLLTETRDHRNKLHYCNDIFFNYLKHVYVICLSVLPKISYKSNIFKILKKTVEENVNTNVIQCNVHSETVNNTILEKFVKFTMFNYFKTLSLVLSGKLRNIEKRDKLQILCLEKYDKHCKFTNKFK